MAAACLSGSISIFPICSSAFITATGAADISSAVAMFRDHEVGSIEVGKRAVLVVLSHDPTLVDPESIRDIVVQRTYVDGELKHSV